MRISIKPNLALQIAAFALATLGATGALVAAGLNESRLDAAPIACGSACGASTTK
jgi:hypothetical protein